jgi:hypothetical protein
MNLYRVWYAEGRSSIDVEGWSEDDAESTAYIKLGYDPGELIAELIEVDPFGDSYADDDYAYEEHRQSMLYGD